MGRAVGGGRGHGAKDKKDVELGNVQRVLINELGNVSFDPSGCASIFRMFIGTGWYAWYFFCYKNVFFYIISALVLL